MHPLIIIIIAVIISIIINITIIIMPQGKPLNIMVFEKGLNRNFSRWLAVYPLIKWDLLKMDAQFTS